MSYLKKKLGDRRYAWLVKGTHAVVNMVRTWQLIEAKEAIEEGRSDEAFYHLAYIAVGYLGVIAEDKWQRNYRDFHKP